MEEFYRSLKIEIEFWRELIDQSDLSQTDPEYLRMQQALKLARHKLFELEIEFTRSVNDATEH